MCGGGIRRNRVSTSRGRPFREVQRCLLHHCLRDLFLLVGRVGAGMWLIVDVYSYMSTVGHIGKLLAQWLDVGPQWLEGGSNRRVPDGGVLQLRGRVRPMR